MGMDSLLQRSYSDKVVLVRRNGVLYGVHVVLLSLSHLYPSDGQALLVRARQLSLVADWRRHPRLASASPP